MKVEECIAIDCPPDEVFAFFDDRANDSRWMGGVSESEWLEPGGSTKVGRQGRMVMNAFGRREFVDEVTQYEPGRRVAHRSVAGSLIIRSACIAEPVTGGSLVTLLYEPERLPGGVLGRLTKPLTSWMTRRNYRADLGRLKRILEGERAAGAP